LFQLDRVFIQLQYENTKKHQEDIWIIFFTFLSLYFVRLQVVGAVVLIHPVYKTQQYLTRACRCNCSNFLKSKLKVKVNKKLELSFTHILVATFYVRPRFIDNHDKTSYPVKYG
jgi:hypothetical protein